MSSSRALRKGTRTLPKSSRLVKKKDFLFRPYRKLRTENFRVVFSQVDPDREGRIGISISKKILKKAVWRNRVRRLLKEVFRTRKEKFVGLDAHFIGELSLKENWSQMTRQDLEQEVEGFLKKTKDLK